MKKTKKQSPEERLQELIAACEERYNRWYYIYENGTDDPFYCDGGNMDLVRNHSLSYKRQIKELCDTMSWPYPDIYYRADLPKVPYDYMAQPDKIIEDAEYAYGLLSSDETYLELCKYRDILSKKQLDSIHYDAVIGYVSRLHRAMGKGDLVLMRLYRGYERYIEAFQQCLDKAKKLVPEPSVAPATESDESFEYVQISLFDFV